MDAQQQLLDERHTALMAAIVAVHDRLDLLNGRTRESERHIAVLDDRSWRSTTVSMSALSAVIAAALYWMTH